MVKNEVLAVLFSFLLANTPVKVNSKVLAKLRNLECFPHPDWVNMTCQLKAVSWRKSLVNVDAVLKQDLNSIVIKAQIFKRYNTYQPFPVKADFEFCPMLAGSDSANNFFVRLLMKLVDNYTNLNHTCPFLKGEKLIVRNLDWESTALMNVPLPSGPGRYRLDVNFYGNGAKTRGAFIAGYADLTEE